MNIRLPLRELLNYGSNLRESRDKYIQYRYPETKEDEKMFKDILDKGCDVCFPVITNTTSLSDISHHPIEIEFRDESGEWYSNSIGPYDRFRSFAKNRDMLYDTIFQHINPTDTLRLYSKMVNRLKIKDCIH